MQLETFRGPDLPSVIGRVRAALGSDALIVNTRVSPEADGGGVEVVAASPEGMADFMRTMDGGRAAAKRARTRARVGPYTVALVGPPGAGKTTTAVKLALHPKGLGGRRVGLITLDTYRVGALEEIQTYAEIANLPLEVAYSPEDVPSALQRLRACDVVVIDTPGRWSGETEWLEVLRKVDPDETHMVLPAGLRHDVARGLQHRFECVGVTHVLFSKVDELEGGAGLAQIAEVVGLPVRWIADGHDVPGALARAMPRILGSAGRRPAELASDRIAG